MLLIPVTHFAQSFRFYSPPDQAWQNRALIVAPSGALNSVQLNGTNVDAGAFAPLPGSAYQYAEIPVAPGQNVITAAQPITVYSIGYNLSQGWSYATPTRF